MNDKIKRKRLDRAWEIFQEKQGVKISAWKRRLIEEAYEELTLISSEEAIIEFYKQLPGFLVMFYAGYQEGIDSANEKTNTNEASREVIKRTPSRHYKKCTPRQERVFYFVAERSTWTLRDLSHKRFILEPSLHKRSQRVIRNKRVNWVMISYEWNLQYPDNQLGREHLKMNFRYVCKNCPEIQEAYFKAKEKELFTEIEPLVNTTFSRLAKMAPEISKLVNELYKGWSTIDVIERGHDQPYANLSVREALQLLNAPDDSK